MKIRPVGAELYHTDGQSDMTKLIGNTRFSKFYERPWKHLRKEIREWRLEKKKRNVTKGSGKEEHKKSDGI
jgi:hypothetical protein